LKEVLTSTLSLKFEESNNFEFFGESSIFFLKFERIKQFWILWRIFNNYWNVYRFEEI